MQGNLGVRRPQGEHFRLPGQVRVRGPVVDPVSNEKLVILSKDVGNQDRHLRRAELHARVSDWFCKAKHLLVRWLRFFASLRMTVAGEPQPGRNLFLNSLW